MRKSTIADAVSAKIDNAITSNDINNAKKGRRDKQPILTINFKEYCKIVVNSEYGTAGMQQACYDAVAMCVKNYAINCYKLKGDLGYNITNVHTGGMSYLPHKSTFLNSCKNAVDNTWNKVMLTTGYGLFKAFFKSDTSASSYCIKNGGQLNLSEINTLVKKQKYTCDRILHYYYDYGKYNKYTSRGAIRIVSTTCTHKYSQNSKKCIICGGSKK